MTALAIAVMQGGKERIWRVSVIRVATPSDRSPPNATSTVVITNDRSTSVLTSVPVIGGAETKRQIYPLPFPFPGPAARLGGMDVLLFRALGLLGLAILVALAARRLRLPYTVGLVLAGAALALFRVNAGLALTHDLIFDVVLPPLLFEAALNLHWSELKRDLVPVAALSTLGVGLCAAVVAGGLVYWLGWSVEAALVFGALISATDPIAVTALLRELKVTGRLRLLIEAESLLNDGAAAVIFTLILAWAAHDPTTAGGPLKQSRPLSRSRAAACSSGSSSASRQSS